MDIVVQKYGGSSVASVDKINFVADKIISKKQEGKGVVVIVSAMGDTTDNLISLAQGISKNPNSREMDMLLTTGEQISISLLSMALIEKGHDAISFTGQQISMKTTSVHQKARIVDIDASRVVQELEKGKIVVVAGFQGVDENNDYTTLGRGGSDTTAVALAVKLKAACEIYTDVEGIYTMDPRKLPRARKLDCISFEEMLEMASLGAGVMHTRSIELAQKFKTPLYVAATHSNNRGTHILERCSDNMEESLVTGMALNDEEIQITVHNLPSQTVGLFQLFSQLAQREVNVDMISQLPDLNGKTSVSFTMPSTDLSRAEGVLTQLKTLHQEIHWMIDEDIAKLSVVGVGMRSHPGVAATVFQAMANLSIPIKMITTSEIKISWLIERKYQAQAISEIGRLFELEG